MHELEQLRHHPDYQDSALLAKLELQHQQKPHHQPLMVFLDIDGTLILLIRRQAEEHLAPTYRQATRDLIQWLDERHIPIVAVTGRQLHEVLNGQAGGTRFDLEQLPNFEVIITAVGTQLDVRQLNGKYQPDSGFEQQFLADTFVREPIYQACRLVVEKWRHHKLEFQVPDQETSPGPFTPYKISFNLESDDEETVKTIVEDLRAKLNELKFTEIRILVSREEATDARSAHYLIDLLPVIKTQAINYLVALSGCLAIYGGDSGNDLDPILHAGHAGFAVGNRRADLEAGLTEAIKTCQPVAQALDPHVQVYKMAALAESDPKQHRLLAIDTNLERKGPASALACIKVLAAVLTVH